MVCMDYYYRYSFTINTKLVMKNNIVKSILYVLIVIFVTLIHIRTLLLESGLPLIVLTA